MHALQTENYWSNAPIDFEDLFVIEDGELNVTAEANDFYDKSRLGPVAYVRLAPHIFGKNPEATRHAQVTFDWGITRPVRNYYVKAETIPEQFRDVTTGRTLPIRITEELLK